MSLWGCREEDAGIPTLETVGQMSDEEATSCLAGYSQSELYAAWGKPTMCFSGLPGDWWEYGDGEKVTVYYQMEYYGEPGEIPVSYVVTCSDVQGLENGGAGG